MSGKTMTVRGLFLDLDGTLMDTAGDFITALSTMRSEDGLPAIDLQPLTQYISEGSLKLVQKAYQLTEDDPQLKTLQTRLLEHYLHTLDQPDRPNAAALYHGISDLLDTLDRRAVPWGVVTNKPLRFAELLMKQHRLESRCHTLVCPEHVQQTKPSPEPLLKACSDTKVPPEQAIYVGDHLRDIEAGNQAGMTTVAALYGFIHPQDDPLLWPASYHVKDARELLALIESKTIGAGNHV